MLTYLCQYLNLLHFQGIFCDEKIPGKIDDAMLQRAGKEVAQMYREWHGKSPLKCTEMIGGIPKEVNAYTEADRTLMEASIAMYNTGTVADGAAALDEAYRIGYNSGPWRALRSACSVNNKRSFKSR